MTPHRAHRDRPPADRPVTAPSPPTAVTARRPNTRRLAAAVGAGLLIALSVPPFGFWPLGIAGVAVVVHLLDGQPVRTRALIGFAAGMGLYGVTLFWFAEFNVLGAVFSMMVEATFLAAAAAATPPMRGRRVGWVGALVLSDWVRIYIPFGGVPLGGIPLGQAAGPLGPSARIGGELLVTALVGLAGVAVEALVTAKPRAVALVALTPVVLLPIAGRVASSGHDVGPMRIAAVQGGGKRGLRAIRNSASAVLEAQFSASQLVKTPVDLVLWPEDVVALHTAIASSPISGQLGALAIQDHAGLVAGVTEDVGTDRFRNAVVVWNDAGQLTGRFDKVHRVPFGEYIPFRGLIKHFVALDVIPRDAIPGHGSGEIQTQAGPVGIVISFEVFFSARSRSAIKAGGEVLLVPTNTASYTTTQVSAAEIAAERLRAWETGRDVVMSAPTGWSAVLDSRGRLLQRSDLGKAQVLQATVRRRTGETPYVRWGDVPCVALAALLLAGGWALALLDRTVNSGKP